MYIQDAVHGYLTLTDVEQRLIATPQFQRLRRVRQLGFTNLVYPSTTHTRFEHSLGAMHLAGRFADSLGVDDGSKQELRVAGLLHDLGHGPFSHTSEMVMEKYDHHHEDFSAEAIRSDPISGILGEAGIDPERVTALIRGRSELGQVIAGDIDVDRMDYLMRDAHYSGVAHGAIDAGTIIRAAEIHDGQLVFDGKFRQALEGILTARYLMTPTVYLHDTVVRAEVMMARGMSAMVDAGVFDVAALPDMDDIDCNYRMRYADVEEARYLMRKIDDREIYRGVLRWDQEDIGRDGLKELARRITDEEAIEEEIAQAAGVDPKFVVVNSPHIPSSRELDVDLWHRGKVRPLDDLSKLTNAVMNSEWEQIALEVYADRGVREKVEAVAADVLREYKGVLQNYL